MLNLSKNSLCAPVDSTSEIENATLKHVKIKITLRTRVKLDQCRKEAFGRQLVVGNDQEEVLGRRLDLGRDEKHNFDKLGRQKWLFEQVHVAHQQKHLLDQGLGR